MTRAKSLRDPTQSMKLHRYLGVATRRHGTSIWHRPRTKSIVLPRRRELGLKTESPRQSGVSESGGGNNACRGKQRNTGPRSSSRSCMSVDKRTSRYRKVCSPTSGRQKKRVEVIFAKFRISSSWKRLSYYIYSATAAQRSLLF